MTTTEQGWSLLWLLSFVLGWLVGWVQTREPLLRKVRDLESTLSLDSAQKMERILMLEQELRTRPQREQAPELPR